VTSYRFSPIQDEITFRAALEYIAVQADKMARIVLGRALSIDTLTIFAHDDGEYAFLDTVVRRYGPVSSFTHGVTLYIASDFTPSSIVLSFWAYANPTQSV